MLVTYNNKEKIELQESLNGKDLVEKLKLTQPDQGLGFLINDQPFDLSHDISKESHVSILNFSDDLGKEMFWHTSAHVLAQAILRIWPEAKPTIGPPIQEGFYYDFANLTISDEDFPLIEKEIKNIIKENFKTERYVFKNKNEALEKFKTNSYKKELIENLGENAELTGYQQGEFFDLCRGPHIPQLGKIKAFKVLKTSGAYWRGDATKEMLTRVYAISFPDKQMLQDYLTRVEEAKKRDHKILGPRLDLFSLKEEAPGMPFIHPKGMIIWNRLLEYWRECHNRAHYVEIKTPIMMSKELWERSGHWYHYKANMYTSSIDDREFAIKPMNCPGGMLFFKTNSHSYRELPLRVGEIGVVHRHEASGALSGLFRVRCFHQDDAHIFMKPSDIENEILGVLSLVDEMYTTFGLTYHLELSTRPEKNTIGSDEEWEMATQGLQGALDRLGKHYRINKGDGAFYGPKIDIHIKDAIGRTWQCGTIQLDMSLPERFELEYVDQNGERKRPIMIHRVIYGSIERFFGILIEHYCGKFPLWLNPRQIVIIPVADRHVEYGATLLKKFTEQGFSVQLDDTHESVSKKVRTAQLNQANYLLTIGDQEVANHTISLRTRDNIVHGEMNVESFLKEIENERSSRSQISPFSKN